MQPGFSLEDNALNFGNYDFRGAVSSFELGMHVRTDILNIIAAGFLCSVTANQQLLCIGDFAGFGQLGGIRADRGDDLCPLDTKIYRVII